MDAAVSVALVTAAVTALGWVVNAWLTARRERQARVLSARLGHTERQLERLYGPLEFELIEGRQVFEDFMSSLGRHYVFRESGSELPADELASWLFYLENSALPRNERIRRLLAENAHLIEGNTMPESYRAFVRHHSSWQLAHLRWQREKVEYGFHSQVNWPPEFGDSVHETFEDLLERHAQLLREAREV